MLYTEKEKHEIERVKEVFAEHLRQSPDFELLWSDKVGYVWLAIGVNPVYVDFKLSFSPEMVRYLKEHQRDFMPEDTKAGMIQAYLDRYTGGMVCSKQLFKEALNHPFDEPKQWEIREVNDIMNHCVTGWNYFSNPRVFPEYGRQKGWERETKATDISNGAEKIPEGFEEVTEQMELPF